MIWDPIVKTIVGRILLCKALYEENCLRTPSGAFLRTAPIILLSSDAVWNYDSGLQVCEEMNACS